jgi:hypothetical protein
MEDQPYPPEIDRRKCVPGRLEILGRADDVQVEASVAPQVLLQRSERQPCTLGVFPVVAVESGARDPQRHDAGDGRVALQHECPRLRATRYVRTLR